MKTLVQSLSDGSTRIIEVPAPSGGSPMVVEARTSLLSAGTERMLVDFGKAGPIGKLLTQRDRARQILSKARGEGILSVVKSIKSKLSWPIPLGYCHVGVVTHSSLADFAIGDRVISASPHGEIATPSPLLAAKLPTNVSDEAASFTPLASIAFGGISLIGPKSGEKVVVVGLGLIGQLAVRLLLARGCKVMGLDPDSARRGLAEKAGAYIPKEGADPVRAAIAWTEGAGVCGVLITASSSSDEIVSRAARSCRQRGRVVLVGVVGLNLNRADFYANEATFQVSQSYGDKTHAGPGSVRENFTEVLELMAEGRLKVEDLITHRFDFDDAPQAYEQLSNPSALGILLRYTGTPSLENSINLRASSTGSCQLALLGAGNYATRTLLPALKEVQGDIPLRLVVSRQGHHAFLAAERFSADRASTDEADAFEDPAVAGVIITTRHDEHVRMAIAALAKGKFPWVEKPLALRFEDLPQIEAAASQGRIMVGFNRRFAPAATKLRSATIDKKGPRRFAAVINAGVLDRGHWALDPARGGGRIVGEACHFVDLARFLVGSPILSVRCTRRDRDGQDGGCFVLEFADGSSGVIDYRTDLPDHMPKEDIEFSGQGWSSKILNWTKLSSEGLGGLDWRSWFVGPRKGQQEALKAYLAALQNPHAPAPISLSELIEVSRASILMQNLSEGETTRI